MSQDLVIINTGCANISSVKYAFERLGTRVTISDEPERLMVADKLLLPGVGSAHTAMSSIREKGLDALLPKLQQPVLGICLGMQLMATDSEEGPGSYLAKNRKLTQKCLNLIPTRIRRMQTHSLVLPHMGWNRVNTSTDSPLFNGIGSNAYFYFVHSFSAPISPYTLARCEYGEDFSAAIGKDNFYGVQFHPERSGDAGAQLLKNFIEL